MSAYRKNVSEGVFAYTDEADKMFSGPMFEFTSDAWRYRRAFREMMVCGIAIKLALRASGRSRLTLPCHHTKLLALDLHETDCEYCHQGLSQGH